MPGKGQTHTPEAKEKIRQAKLGTSRPDLKGRAVSSAVREKIRNSLLGRKHSAETRAKISAAQRTIHNPSKPELMLYAELDQRRYKHTGQLSAKQLGLPISTDILCRAAGLLILVDGCHYHECPQHGNGFFPHRPARDAAKTALAEARGWAVLRVWEHNIRDSRKLARVVQKIERTRRYLLSL